MSSSSAAQRRRTAYAAAAASKQRRQKVIAIIGFVVFIGILVYEAPHTLKLLRHNGGSAPPASPASSAQEARPRTLPKAFRGAAGSDPFAIRSLVAADPTIGPASGRDPFAASGTTDTAPATTAASELLPQQIVIGTPTKNGTTLRGWIVILASIPTREGRASALAFARKARQNGIASVSVLNSSNRRPLRGGYWVVYTAPLPTLAAAGRRAASIHSSGYRSAYLRELIVYR
jgi:SPOR domain